MLLFVVLFLAIFVAIFNINEAFTIWTPRSYDKYNQWGLRDNRKWVYQKNYYYPYLIDIY